MLLLRFFLFENFKNTATKCRKWPAPKEGGTRVPRRARGARMEWEKKSPGTFKDRTTAATGSHYGAQRIGRGGLWGRLPRPSPARGAGCEAACCQCPRTDQTASNLDARPIQLCTMCCTARALVATVVPPPVR